MTDICNYGACESRRRHRICFQRFMMSPSESDGISKRNKQEEYDRISHCSEAEESVLIDEIGGNQTVVKETDLIRPRYGAAATVCGRRIDMEDTISIHPSFVRKQTENSTSVSRICSEADEIGGNDQTVVKETDLIRPRYGAVTVCGRRIDMEDTISIHPSFIRKQTENSRRRWHYFGVFDGHGCSHVASRCKQRLHELVKEESEVEGWKKMMDRSFMRMDKEVCRWRETVMSVKCKCEIETPECDAVGSTAVVSVVTPEKIVVANCGDSRAVLFRNGKTVPLSTDHKPDRPDELNRIKKAGGQVIYWDGPRVSGILATSRALGNNYLKPYVTSEPEVTVTDRTEEDEFLILASDGLWDVVSNETACSMVQMYMNRKRRRRGETPEERKSGKRGEIMDKVCTEASVLLTKLALTKHSSDNVSVVVVDLRRRRKRHVDLH